MEEFAIILGSFEPNILSTPSLKTSLFSLMQTFLSLWIDEVENSTNGLNADLTWIAH